MLSLPLPSLCITFTPLPIYFPLIPFPSFLPSSTLSIPFIVPFPHSSPLLFPFPFLFIPHLFQFPSPFFPLITFSFFTSKLTNQVEAQREYKSRQPPGMCPSLLPPFLALSILPSPLSLFPSFLLVPLPLPLTPFPSLLADLCSPEVAEEMEGDDCTKLSPLIRKRGCSGRWVQRGVSEAVPGIEER